MGQKDQYLAKNDQNWPFLGQFWQNYYFAYDLPHPNFTLGICIDYFWQQNLSQSVRKREPAHFSKK